MGRQRLFEVLIVALLALVRVVRDLRLLWLRPDDMRSWEEGYNISSAWFLAEYGDFGLIPALQYKAFCGGCTVVSVVGMPWLALFGDDWLAFKGLAMAGSVLTLVVAWWVSRTAFGATTGVLLALAIALAPTGVRGPALMLWGNHAEAQLAVLVVLGLAWARRPALLAMTGPAAVAAVWACLSSLPVLAAVPFALWRGAPRALTLAMMALAAGLWLPDWGAGDVGTYQVDVVGNLMAFGPELALRRAWSLVSIDDAARRLVTTLSPVPVVMAAGLVLGGLTAIVLNLFSAEPRRRLLAVAALLYALAFAMSSFPIPPADERFVAAGGRYHVHWVLWLQLNGAAALGAWLPERRVHLQYALVSAVAAAVLVANGVAVWALEAPSSGPITERVRHGIAISERVSGARFLALEPTTEAGRSHAQRLAGLAMGREVRRGERALGDAVARLDGDVGWRALGFGLVEGPDTRVVGAHGPAAAAIGEGAALARALALESARRRQRVSEQVELRVLLAEALAREGCIGCLELGHLVAMRCDGALDCVVDAARDMPAAAVEVGLGLGSRRLSLSPVEERGLEATMSAAFNRGRGMELGDAEQLVGVHAGRK